MTVALQALSLVEKAETVQVQVALGGEGLLLWPSVSQCRIFFIRTSTPTPSMHRKLAEHGKCCMQKKTQPTLD
jgi:hypothetical protein